jgi:hypothetical protein
MLGAVYCCAECRYAECRYAECCGASQVGGFSQQEINLEKGTFTRAIFHIGVTFEMRTVLYEIHLLIDTHQIVRQHFISNRNGGEKSKIAERQIER